MLLATIYQFSDTIQVVCAGALRGYKDTKSILYITFVSYWLIGLSVGLIVLGMTDWIVPKMGPYGFWIGFHYWFDNRSSIATCLAFISNTKAH